MSKIFKPRRAQQSTMLGPKANTVLAAGEMFVEFEGTPGQSKAALKFGDGTTAYSSLPYALKNTDVSTSKITIVADTSQTLEAALNNVVSDRSTASIVGSLKQAIYLTKNEFDNTLEKRLTTTGSNTGTKFYFDYQNGKFGYNTSPERGADTFSPFSNGEDAYNRGYADGFADLTHGTSVNTYHHHATSGTDIHVNDNTSQTGGVGDGYHSATSGGCFTKVVYKAHVHTSSCYTTATCNHGGAGDEYVQVDWISDRDSEGYLTVTIHCKMCGTTAEGQGYDEGDARRSAVRHLRDNPYTYTYLSCGKTAGVRYQSDGVDYYTRTCGIPNGQLISTLITY